ncbi:MAG: hypothetical protein H6R26_580, partial [Proteobacteria bacterium]|nr:hypothetical protein [Pseudomonadota bacterium]
RKLESIPDVTVCVETVRGRGYRLISRARAGVQEPIGKVA